MFNLELQAYTNTLKKQFYNPYAADLRSGATGVTEGSENGNEVGEGSENIQQALLEDKMVDCMITVTSLSSEVSVITL